MLVQCSILELTLLHCHALESRSYVWALDYDATSVTAVTLVNKILDGQFESDMHCKLVCLHKKSIVEKTHLLFQHMYFSAISNSSQVSKMSHHSL